MENKKNKLKMAYSRDTLLEIYTIIDYHVLLWTIMDYHGIEIDIYREAKMITDCQTDIAKC